MNYKKTIDKANKTWYIITIEDNLIHDRKRRFQWTV